MIGPISTRELEEMRIAAIEAPDTGGPLCPSRVRRLIEDGHSDEEDLEERIEALESELDSTKDELRKAEDERDELRELAKSFTAGLAKLGVK